jgi:predicted AlkP superfamily pyrophosphatase or phosphodiesterase
MRSVLPSTSASCYASIHTGVPPQVHGIWDNAISAAGQPDVFSEVDAAGRKTGAVTHSYWSEFFNRAPFDVVRDIEYDEPGGPITHGRFHTMTGYGHDNQMTPSDYDLFGTLTRLCEVKGIDYGILHTCTLDSMGHRFFHDCEEMDHACYAHGRDLAPFIARWRQGGLRGDRDRRPRPGRPRPPWRHRRRAADFALYYFGTAEMPGRMWCWTNWRWRRPS